MEETEALKILEAMSDEQFNAFLASLPQRTQLLVRGRVCDWREVLPKWYIQSNGGRALKADEIPF